jgi:hypothetical protein
MTQREAKQAVQALGLVLRYTPEYDEYRIDYRPDDARRSGDSAYFTQDRTDAVDTARRMAAWQGVATVPRTHTFVGDSDNRSHAFAWAAEYFGADDSAALFVAYLCSLEDSEQCHVFLNGYRGALTGFTEAIERVSNA